MNECLSFAAIASMAHNIGMVAGQHGGEHNVDPALSAALSRDGAEAFRMTSMRLLFCGPGALHESNLQDNHRSDIRDLWIPNSSK
jgi:hypothetical protein